MNLVYLALFGILILFTMALVSNTGMQSIDRIEEQIFLINCPPPIYNGDITNLSVDGFVVNYTLTRYDSNTAFNGTFFECSIDSITGAFTVSASSEEYDETLFSTIPIGYFGYLSDTLTSQAGKIVNYMTLLSFVLTPANFSLLGYTLADLSGIALGVVVGIYFIAYLFITIFVVDRITSLIGSFT